MSATQVHRLVALNLLVAPLYSVSAADLHLAKQRVTNLAFGSCHKNEYVLAEDNQPSVWDALLDGHRPDAFLWTGDTVYPPRRGIKSIEELETEYHKTTSLLARHKFPPLGFYGTWDDHDYGGNDMGNRMPNRTERRRALFDFLNYTKADWFPMMREGVYHSIDFGEPPEQVKVVLLDTRWHRDDLPFVPHALATSFPLGAGLACILRWLRAGLGLFKLWSSLSSSQRTSVLGEEQWSWFQKELVNSEAQLHVVVSSIQVLTTNPVVESWGHFPHERQRLLRLLKDRRDVPTVLLSGDVHHAEVIEPFPDTLMEVTSSGLTHSCTKPFYGGLCEPLLRTFAAHRGKAREHDYYIGRNFGTVRVDWGSPGGRFRVDVWNAAGNTSVLTTGWKPLGSSPPPSSVGSSLLPPWDIDSLPQVVDGHLIPKVRGLLVRCLIAAMVVLQIWVWFVLVPRAYRMNRRQARDAVAVLADNDEFTPSDSIMGSKDGGLKSKIE